MTDYRPLIAEMRAVAHQLRRFNGQYDWHVEGGSWSPAALEYEASYLETHNNHAGVAS